MYPNTVFIMMARHLCPSHESRIFKMSSQLGQAVRLRKALKVRQNVQYPVIAHVTPHFIVANKKRLQL